MQLITVLIAAVAVLRHNRAASEIKAMALGTGILLTMLHLLTYDLVVLAAPVASQFRLGRADGFLLLELVGMALSGFSIFPLLRAPVGCAAVLVVMAPVICRVMALRRVAT